MTTTVLAQPYEAQQCPECEEWVYSAAGPFAENDPTKPLAPWLHWEARHLSDMAPLRIGFPYFSWNREPVEATRP